MGGKQSKPANDCESKLTAISLSIDQHLTAVLRSTEIKSLKPDHRNEFLALTNEYHNNIDQKVKITTAISREITLYKLKKNQGNTSYQDHINNIRSYIEQLVREDKFKEIKQRCEKLMLSITCEESYSDSLKRNWKMITGGIGFAFGAAILVILVVLHCIPIVHFVLGIGAFIAACILGVLGIISSIILIINGNRATETLKKDFVILSEILAKMDINGQQNHVILGQIEGMEKMKENDSLEVFIIDIEKACKKFNQVVQNQYSSFFGSVRSIFWR
ncbi:hypothetical protein PPL_07677 [Heterostelium album PN500]|uniref:Uncharacterized protein n=1 Tax=Heterostelium pallidum (strain ATCC 26659 / Pp 5 / PN500) TaxID=670386 RepID=D3BGM5_HETP5|nr:hypothetical protein PPL_07677 [Heterostelium album PN500]EFA79259.1 hypothetical protein PPL_07677 [Heterostelium album PN500]|eukprot:XP_020431380.1 hypothetical protein PPL_07677 [Heterostelium album PN500]